jgi:hypothetical protein
MKMLKRDRKLFGKSIKLKETARVMAIILALLCKIMKEYRSNSSKKKMPRFPYIHLVLDQDDKWNLLKMF